MDGTSFVRSGALPPSPAPSTEQKAGLTDLLSNFSLNQLAQLLPWEEASTYLSWSWKPSSDNYF